MAPKDKNKVWKKQPTKDGRNARQRRADKKRAARLTSGKHTHSHTSPFRPTILPQSSFPRIPLLTSPPQRRTASHGRRDRPQEPHPSSVEPVARPQLPGRRREWVPEREPLGVQMGHPAVRAGGERKSRGETCGWGGTG